MPKPNLPFASHRIGERSNQFAVDDRMYDDIGEDFDPSFVKRVKPKPQGGVVSSNPALVRRNHSNKFVRKEQRTLESLRREWQAALQTEEEKVEKHVTEVFKVNKRVRAEFVTDLKSNLDSIEQFFVKEIAPVEVALADALDRARQTIAIITESDVEESSFNAVHLMFQDAIRLKTFDFLCTKLQLTPHLRQVLIEKYFRPDTPKKP